jgi:hypothetical protein
MLRDKDEAPNPAQRFKAWLIRYWREEAGSAVDRMLQDRTEAERALKDSDWKVRCTALSILQHHWELDSGRDFAERCEDLGLHDVDPQVRGCALITLGMCYENTNDERIGKLLAEVVFNETEDSHARRGAYMGLYYLRGRAFQWVGGSSDRPHIIRVPDDFDWSFVKSFCGE